MAEGVNGTINDKKTVAAEQVIRRISEDDNRNMLNRTSGQNTLNATYSQQLIEATTHTTDNDAISDKGRGAVQRYWLETVRDTGKYVTSAEKTFVKTAHQNSTLKHQKKRGEISKDVMKAEVTTNKKAAAKTILTSPLKAYSQSVSRKIESFGNGSDELGIKAAALPKDIYFTIKNSVTTTKRVVTFIPRLVNGIKGLYRTVTNPVTWKFIGIGAGVLGIVMMVAMVIVILAGTSYKGSEKETSLVWKEITLCDYEFQQELLDINRKKASNTVVNYYYGGYRVSPEDITIYTDAEKLICYFEVKYDGYYNLNPIAFSSTPAVKDEVHDIHTQLYSYTKSSQTKTETVADRTGTTHHYTVNTINVYIHSVSAASWMDTTGKAELGREYTLYQTMSEAEGGLNLNILAASPFDDNWHEKYVGRYGWRSHPITGDKNEHNGIDIAFTYGTPIYAATGGTADCEDSGSDGYGLYVMIKKDNNNYTLYGHCSSLVVSEGQAVKIGDLIGYVGSTGTSTGNHLHFELVKDGNKLNPLLYTAYNE